MTYCSYKTPRKHPPFRLRTSSNTPSVRINVVQGSFADPDEEMRFPSCSFCLKRRLVEPAPFKTRLQFGRAQQPVRTNPRLSFKNKEQGVMGKLARIATVPLEHVIAMSVQRGVTSPK
jgi:hypothetical protein